MRVFLLLLLLPAACTQTDLFYRAGDWTPQGANARNLAAMVAEPSDMVRGRGDTGADSPLAIAAVSRLMEGKAKPLANAASQNDVAPTAAPNPAPGGS